MSINRVMICGRLTRDPEMRSTAGGLAVMGLGVAVNDRRRNQQTGEWEDVPNYVDCTMFGPYAQAMERRLSKGAKVAIDGRLRWSQWERDGQKRSKIEVIVDELEFMSSRNSDAQYSSGQSYGQQGGYQPASQASYQSASQAGYQPQSAPTIDASSSVYDDDIPF